MRAFRPRPRFVALLALALPACGATEPEVQLGEVPARVAIVGGNYQQLDPGQTAPLNLEVRVTDSTALPVPRVPVEWIVDGGGFVRPYNRSTDVGGKVVAELTLTRTIGVREVVAYVRTDSTLYTTFTIFGGVPIRPSDLPEAEILITMSGFQPALVSVPAGGYVRFRWAGDSPHDVRFDDPDVGRIFSRIEGVRDIYLPVPGDFGYRCSGYNGAGGFVGVADYPPHPPHTGRILVN